MHVRGIDAFHIGVLLHNAVYAAPKVACSRCGIYRTQFLLLPDATFGLEELP
jgi:hypothetical protein